MREGIWTIVKMSYKIILRPLLVKAIDDPDSEVDDFILRLLDNLFEYEKNE